MDISKADRQKLTELHQRWLDGLITQKIDLQELRGLLTVYQVKATQQGKAEATVRERSRILVRLAKKADLNDPPEVWETIDKYPNWSENTKSFASSAYKSFCRIFQIQIPRYLDFCKWISPEKLPFIPLEKEIDALIAGCNRKTAAFLQLLKETALRSGEAWNLKYSDLDFETRILTMNNPEKRGKPRQFRLSEGLIAMLKALPRRSNSPDKLFLGSQMGFRTTFLYQRRRVAATLQNPRILKIHFHTLRHWKATIEYHKTKDILHVQNLLGHRNVNSTMLYTHLIDFKGEEYHSATAKTVDEAKDLIEKGFEYVTQMDGVKLFRKRK